MNRIIKSVFKFKAGLLLFPAFLFLFFFFTVYIFQDKFTVLISNRFVVENTIEKADAIVVLGGSIPDRLLEAAALYKEGYSELLLITRTPDPTGYRFLKKHNANYPLNHEIILGILSKMDIERDRIVVLDGISYNTYIEAQKSINYLDDNNFDSIIVVTSKLHTKRASIIFNDLANNRFSVYMKPSRYDPFNADNPHIARIYAKTILLEFQKIIFYKVTNYFLDYYPTFN